MPSPRRDVSARSGRPGFLSPSLVRGVAVLVAALATTPASSAAEAPRALRLKQMIETEALGIRHPVGITYAGDADLFIVLRSDAAGTGSTPPAAELMDRWNQPVASLAFPARPASPRAVAYDRPGERLLLLDPASRAVHAIPGGAAGTFAVERVSRLEAPRVGPLRPVGMTVDPATGQVYVLDRLLRRIVRFAPAASDASPEVLAAAPTAEWIPLGPLGSADLTGLAFDPASGHLFTLNMARRELLELAVDGTLVATRDVSSFRLSDPQGMVFAPSGDPTDDAGTLSLFIADPGLPSSRRGHVIELAWVRSAPPAEETVIQAATAATLPGTGHHGFACDVADGAAVDVHRARAALPDAAAELGARQADVIANDPQQRSLGIRIDGMHGSVDGQSERHNLLRPAEL